MVVVLLLKLLLFQLLPCASSLSFNFPSFTSDNNLSTKGNAYVDGEFIRLTQSGADMPHDKSVGRATYSQPLLLREKAIGKLLDFTTNFTFSINSQGKKDYSDGLAFFLASNWSSLDRPLPRGVALGLPYIFNESKQYPFVAVEFDIYKKIGDPDGDHIGIDINSLQSKITKLWNGSISNGKINTAQIGYNSGSKNLSVVYTSFENDVQVWRNISYIVDLTEYLQGNIVVGFSAATRKSLTLHRINTWSFNSTELLNENAMNNPPLMVPVPEPNPIVELEPGNGVNVGLLVGLVVGKDKSAAQSTLPIHVS